MTPIPRYQKYLLDRKVLNKKRIEEIEAGVLAEVAGAVERYEAMRDVSPLDCFDYMYKTLPRSCSSSAKSSPPASNARELAKGIDEPTSFKRGILRNCGVLTGRRGMFDRQRGNRGYAL